MAMRLDNVKPYIHKVVPPKVNSPTNSPRANSARKIKKNKHGVPGLEFPKGLFNQGNELNSTRSNASGQNSSRNNKNKTRINSAKKSSEKKNSNVLLEYSKIQNGRVLDIAVIKEPYQDRYAIFGIDIDNGQRYELRLSSDDVSSILDGDILVTSLDNVEEWTWSLSNPSRKCQPNKSIPLNLIPLLTLLWERIIIPENQKHHLQADPPRGRGDVGPGLPPDLGVPKLYHLRMFSR